MTQYLLLQTASIEIQSQKINSPALGIFEQGTGPLPVDEEEAPVEREDGVGGQLAGLFCPSYRGQTEKGDFPDCRVFLQRTGICINS